MEKYLNLNIYKLMLKKKPIYEKDLNVLGQYVGEGYGIVTQEVIEAIHLAAKTDAIICDPNYTGTVMAALIDQIRKNNINENETVIFIHTGGLPALFTFSEELSAFSF